MAALTRLIIVAALFAATPARADNVDRWQPYIEEASTRFGVPTAWIERVMRAESAGATMRGGRPIRSVKGAIGLMQLMPATWADMRARLGLGPNPDDPHDNILAGTFYLRLMYERFGYPGLFAAYNAGPARYATYLAGKQSLPGETIAYLATVSRTVSGGAVAPVLPVSPPSSLPSPSRPPTLFAVRRELPTEAKPTENELPQASLFAIRNVAP